MKKTVKATLVLVMLAHVCGCHVYRSETIEGWVVDDETRRPLSNAVVVAVWEAHGGSFHPSVAGTFHALETVTDAAGRYSLQKWGPKLALSSYLKSTEPTLIAFHADYSFWVGSNNGDLKPPPRISYQMMKSDWSGRAIPLKKKSGDHAAIEANARSAERYLLLDVNEKCAWERMPRLALELMRRGEQSRVNGIPSILPGPEKLYRGGSCAQPGSLGETR